MDIVYVFCGIALVGIWLFLSIILPIAIVVYLDKKYPRRD